jgi:hypothetical protein
VKTVKIIIDGLEVKIIKVKAGNIDNLLKIISVFEAQ